VREREVELKAEMPAGTEISAEVQISVRWAFNPTVLPIVATDHPLPPGAILPNPNPDCGQ
jgi:hypothetical protein